MENAPISLEYSSEALLEFLDYLGKKGLVNQNTVVSRKAACSKMLGILDPIEAADVRSVDLDRLATRFGNLRGKSYSPKSLQVYKSRVNTSIHDFLRYKENPANFKIVGGDTKTSSGFKVKPRPVKLHSTSAAPMQDMNSRTLTAPLQAVSTINFPVPLRSNVVVQINGLPVDLTKQEAAKICAVVQAMASVE